MTLAFRPEAARAGSRGPSMYYQYVVLLSGIFLVANVVLAIAAGRFIRLGMSEDAVEEVAPVRVRNKPDVRVAARAARRLMR
jgi:hypothetical protein